ncbi:MAG: zinc ribbon domain-containing protein [Phycisphaeraceae bacterium]
MSICSDDDWFTCPVCGEVVQADALACPHCGADDETGWSQDAEYDALGLDEEALGGPTPRQIRPWFSLVAAALAALILFWVINGVW